MVKVTVSMWYSIAWYFWMILPALPSKEHKARKFYVYRRWVHGPNNT